MNGIWENEQEWRDQIMCQMIYIRQAIYFVAFVIAITQAAPWLKVEFGASEEIMILVYGGLAIFATIFYIRAASKSKAFEKAALEEEYDDN